MPVFEGYYPENPDQAKVIPTKIEGLFEVKHAIHEDERGDFCVTWSHGLEDLGLPPHTTQQVNRAKNVRGATRGIHGEPWDKYVSPIFGTFFAAIVDLRPDSPTFGEHESFELDETNAIYVPNGCGNSYQALTDGVYSYYVGGLWSPDLDFTVVDCYDPELAIDWPIPRDEAIMSERDKFGAATLKSAFDL
jgi:dTDP-4-dehydrorhamnose 3,5-epimerase